jgi:hypothetical protein
MRSTVLGVALIASLTAGCPAPAEPDPNVPAACHGTYSGAVTGSFDCAALALRDGAGVTTIAFDIDYVTLTGTAMDISLQGLAWDGALTPGTYAHTTNGVTGSFFVAGGTELAPISYLADWDPSAMPDLGSFTLTLDSADALAPAVSGTPYDIHGVLAVTLVPYPADEGAGTVTVAVSF